KTAAIGYYVFLVFYEFRRTSFPKANCFCSNDMHQRSPLQTWKHSFVDALPKFGLSQDRSSSRSPKRFMCRGCHHMGMLDWIGMKAGSHKSGIMRHVYHKICPNFVCNLPKITCIDDSWICASAGHDQFRAMFPRQTPHLLKI